ncbi:hypothetical protein D046_9191, partial [Vibrio parahaemolyticus V-223/04]
MGMVNTALSLTGCKAILANMFGFSSPLGLE